MKRLIGVLALLGAAFAANAEVQVINGQKYECRDGLCYLVEDDSEDLSAPVGEDADGTVGSEDADGTVRGGRIAQGYMRADEFIAFLEGKDSGRGRLAPERGLVVLLVLVLLGGLAMNLTPCVLPMVPINLMIIGRSAGRGAAYGMGIALAYGLLGIGAAVGGLAFGDIQGSPWFNAAVAVVFVGLALALFDVWFLDLARFRSGSQISNLKSQISAGGTQAGEHRAGLKLGALLFPFGMGALSAVLAGACVAPVLISVLVLTADLVSKGNRFAILLPFVMGIGMALPWPFAGAGMKVLPKPGGWMKWVNRVFGVVVLGFAAWYGWLAWQGFSSQARASGSSSLSSSSSLSGDSSSSSAVRTLSATPATLNSQLLTLNSESAKPILVDCWATWCKNCAAMEKVLGEAKVQEALKPFTVIRLQAEDMGELRKLKGFESIRGLPAFVIFE